MTLAGPFTVSRRHRRRSACPATADASPLARRSPAPRRYTISQADLDAGSVTNVAIGARLLRSGAVSSADRQRDGHGGPEPGPDLDKTPSRRPTPRSATSIAYSYLVTNSGNVTLAGPFTVSDDQTTVTCPATASLAPGPVDHLHRDVHASPRPTSTPARSPTSPPRRNGTRHLDRPTRPPSPPSRAAALTIDKTSVDTAYAAVGDVLHYSYLVTNSATSTLTGPFTVSDDKATDETCPATASLAPARVDHLHRNLRRHPGRPRRRLRHQHRRRRRNGTTTSPTDTAHDHRHPDARPDARQDLGRRRPTPPSATSATTATSSRTPAT